ncbi:MAG: heparinase II/III family protein [Candidatus Ratteibacteria bacterium]
MTENIDWMGYLKKGRPRLILNEELLINIKNSIEKNNDFRNIYLKIKENADKILNEPVSKYEIPDGLRLLKVSKEVLNRTYILSFVYQIEKDERYIKRLWEEILSASNFPDWNPKHFLDTAEMSHAFAIAYDWNFNYWNEEQKRIIRESVLNKSLKEALDCYEGRSKYGWWVKSKHNWNQVCNGGIGIAAICFLDEYTEICSKILDYILKSLPLAMKEFAPDGAWGEGVGYWAYATEYNFIFLAYLENCIKFNFDFWGYEGVSETGLFPIYMTGPIGKTFNFADCSENPVRSTQMLYLTKKFKNPVFAWYSFKYPRYHPLDLIWYENFISPKEANLPLDKYFRYVEVVSMRSGWNKDDLYVGFKGGRNNFNHSHLDLGSFVFDALGHRWVIDLGRDNYNLPGYFGKNRWDYYRLRAEGHNTIVINPDKGPDQQPDGVSNIKKFVSKNDYSFAIADLTDAYRKYSKDIKRGILMNKKDRYLIVQDEIELKEKGEIWWFLHTFCDIELKNKGKEAILKQKETNLIVRIIEPENIKFLILPAKPLSNCPNPEGQNPNEGVKKLALNIKDTDKITISILLKPYLTEEEIKSIPNFKHLKDWN